MFVSCKGLSSTLAKNILHHERWHGCTLVIQSRIRLLTVHKLHTSARCSTDAERPKSSTSLASGKDNKQLSEHVFTSERIKQTGKDATYISIIIVGIGIFSFVFYAVFKELFSSKSPSSVFASALKKCKQDPRITDALGEPIKGHGEMTSRRRARHVSFVEYDNNGTTFMRVKFYLKGSKGSGTVQCETSKSSPRSHFRYLFVQMDAYPHQVIVIEDNRLIDDQLISE